MFAQNKYFAVNKDNLLYNLCLINNLCKQRYMHLSYDYIKACIREERVRVESRESLSSISQVNTSVELLMIDERRCATLTAEREAGWTEPKELEQFSC